MRKVLKNLKNTKFFQINELDRSDFTIMKIQEILKRENIPYSNFTIDIIKNLIANENKKLHTKNLENNSILSSNLNFFLKNSSIKTFW